MTKPKRPAPKLAPLTPDFSRPVPDSKLENLKRQNAAQQRIIDDLRSNCGEYKRLIKLLQNVETLKPSHNPTAKEKA